MTLDATRRLTTASLMKHWEAGVPIVIPIAGEPKLLLRMNPNAGQLTLRAPIAEAKELPQQLLAHVCATVVADAGTNYIEISTTDRRLVVDGYAMLMAIADRVQLADADPLEAFVETLEVWRSILAERSRMSGTTEIGLFGELLVLQALLAAGVSAPTAWRGGLGEEHDFGLDDSDVEVKTTTSERRQHWIHGLTQMVGTGPTPLWLVSLQITRSGDGTGVTLPEQIDIVLEAADESARELIVKNLREIGWREQSRDLFDERWRLRSEPLALRVDDAFPRLTPDLLKRIGADISRFRQVAYEIDLSDKPPGAPPSSLAAILDTMRGAADD